MKWAFRNKTAEKRPKMAIFKLLVLSYMLTTLVFPLATFTMAPRHALFLQRHALLPSAMPFF